MDFFINPSQKELKECGYVNASGVNVGGVRGAIYDNNLVIANGGIHSMILDELKDLHKIEWGGVGQYLDKYLGEFLCIHQHRTSNDFYIGESYSDSFFKNIKDSSTIEYEKAKQHFEKMKEKNYKYDFIMEKIK